MYEEKKSTAAGTCPPRNLEAGIKLLEQKIEQCKKEVENMQKAVKDKQARIEGAEKKLKAAKDMSRNSARFYEVVETMHSTIVQHGAAMTEYFETGGDEDDKVEEPEFVTAFKEAWTEMLMLSLKTTIASGVGSV